MNKITRQEVEICLRKGDKKQSKRDTSWLSLYKDICVQYIKQDNRYKIINLYRLPSL